MSLPFVDRPPNDSEVEKIRLLLSTYQDGTGMLATKDGRTLPGWRDFERSVALALNGTASESKDIFDVVLARPEATIASPKYGLSCKMRSELNRIRRDGRVNIEVSNSAGKFWDYLATKGLNQGNYRESPREVGVSLIELIDTWHQAESIATGGTIDLGKSCYLVLLWNGMGDYQLFQYRLNVIDPAVLIWSFPPPRIVKGQLSETRRLIGHDGIGTLVEWYGESGGQLKFYPFVTSAVWNSHQFRLEPLPGIEHGILNKVVAYFPDQWTTACNDAV